MPITNPSSGGNATVALPIPAHTIRDVANNAAKLALTALGDGQVVRVTGESNRLEKFVDPSASSADSPSTEGVPGLIPEGWGQTVVLNGVVLTWDGTWYSGGGYYVQGAYDGPYWLAEINNTDGSSQLNQQYFIPRLNGTPRWTHPSISFLPGTHFDGVAPAGGFHLQGVSGLSLGYVTSFHLPTDTYSALGTLSTYMYGFTAPAHVEADEGVWRPLSPLGDATPDMVLVESFFSNATRIGAPGVMPNNGALMITPSASPQAIAAGYHNGSGVVAGDADLVAGNIKDGVEIFGVTGTVIEGDATVPGGLPISPKQAWVDGVASLLRVDTGLFDGRIQLGSVGITTITPSWVLYLMQLAPSGSAFQLKLDGNALNQAGVDALLAYLATNSGSFPGWNLYLDGGTNASPTDGSANADIVTLEGAGWAVTIN